MKVQILIPFLFYLVILAAIGIYTMRKVPGGIQIFFLGDKKLNPFYAAVSSAISARGAWLLLGVTTQAYVLGLSAIWVVAGYIISEFFINIFVAPAIRRISVGENYLTLADLLTAGFKYHIKTLRIVLSASLLFFSLCFIAAQFMGGGKSFYAFFGLSPVYGIIITGMISLLFSFLGGYKTITISDLLNALIIIAVLVILPYLLVLRREGFDNIHAEILAGLPDFFSLRAISFGVLFGFLAFGLSSFGNPGIIGKYLANRAPFNYSLFTVINSGVSLLMAAGALSLGIFARVYFPLPESLPGADSQNVFFGIAGEVFSPVMLGVVLISIFAALISSSGMQILTSALSVTSDLYEKTLKRDIQNSELKLGLYSRMVMILLVYIAIIAGIFIKMDFYDFVLFSLAGFAATTGPALLFTLYWKKVSSGGIIAGIISGGLTVIIWKFNPALSEMIYELVPGFIIAAIATLAGSHIDRKQLNRKFNRTARYEDINKSGNFE